MEGRTQSLSQLVLSPSQQQALDGLCDEYEHAAEGRRCALLYGVTGSGKTRTPYRYTRTHYRRKYQYCLPYIRNPCCKHT